MKIDTVLARSIPDTRGKATIETTLITNQFSGTASVPSGKSTGSYEALELRDSDGGVSGAIENVHTEIANAIIGREFDSPDDLDKFLIQLDGTPNKSRLGANAILSVSIAAMRLFANTHNIPLWKAMAERAGTKPGAPRLYMNVMNGGVHADFKLPFQEYILVVDGPTSSAYSIAQEAFAKLGERLDPNVPMGDEGGYAPTFDNIEEPFEILAKLVSEFPGTSIAIDAAASELETDGSYRLLDTSYSEIELANLYEKLVAQYPIHSIEDPFSEDADDAFARLTLSLGNKILIVGDDFTVTNPERIAHAVHQKAINAVLIKPNQIGSVRETILAVQATYATNFATIASHRSGETDDTFIADFAYAIGAHGIKAGGLGQKERLEKYERLLEIENENKRL